MKQNKCYSTNICGASNIFQEFWTQDTTVNLQLSQVRDTDHQREMQYSLISILMEEKAGSMSTVGT